MGASTASAIHTMRMTPSLNMSLTGTNAITNVAAAGKKTPTTKSGQSTERIIAMETISRFFEVRRPKRAATDQPMTA